MDRGRISEIVSRYLDSGIEQQIDFKKFYLYSIITHSTAVEGSTITELENQLLFDEGIAVADKPMVEQLMNLDLRDAYLMGYRLVDENHGFTTDTLKQLAAAVMRRTGSVYNTMAGQFDSSKGDIRLCNVTAGVGGRSYMSYLKVPEKLNSFVEWLNDSIKNLKSADIYTAYALSFEAHYRLVTIHPWVDGNGRTTRLLMNMLQYMAGVPQNRILPKDKSKYIRALIDSRENDNPEIFIECMMELHADDLIRQINLFEKDTADDRINRVDDRINALRDRINDRIKNIDSEKLLRLCSNIALNPMATAEESAAIIGVSVATANRYLKLLKDAGILSRKGARKNGYWEINFEN